MMMPKRLFYFRPGEEARMLARCQFHMDVTGACGATLTYPNKGYPWRRNIVKHFEFQLGEEEARHLFAEVRLLKAEHPAECLANRQLWNDASEKANGITRDRSTGRVCHTIGISEDGEHWVGLIRIGGHLSYGGYDVQTDGRHTETPRAAAVH
jgi:hypothetical protein